MKHGLLKRGLIKITNKDFLKDTSSVKRELIKPRECKTWTSKLCEFMKRDLKNRLLIKEQRLVKRTNKRTCKLWTTLIQITSNNNQM